MLDERGHRCQVLHSCPSRYDFFPLVGWRASQLIRQSIRYWHRLRIKLSRFDVVVLETEMFHTDDASFEVHIRNLASRLIYDVDDAVFLLFPEKCEAIARMADHVIAGNEKIAVWARNFNAHVSVIPTCIDEQIYTPKNDGDVSNHGRPVIGWIGSSGNFSMLNVVSTALRRLATELDFELRLVTSLKAVRNQVDLSGINVVWVDIDRCDVISELHKMDIGIMPLESENPWMHFKCNAKMIQYMGVGVPAVGTAIGFSRSLIEHGKNGMLASDDADWESSLRQLLGSANLRRSLGAAGRETILKSFTVQSQIAQYESILMGKPSE